LIWVRREAKYFCKWGWKFLQMGLDRHATDLPDGHVTRIVIASAAKQSIQPQGSVDCFVAALLAMTKRTFVIPGRAQREPGIHTPDRGYGFRACANGRIPE
jgi:hypothetical protein